MVYAKIKDGVIVNTQMIAEGDYLDPNFVWVNITGLFCVDGSAIQIGCVYDGTNFNPQGA